MTLISYGFSYYIDKLFLLPHRHVRILKDLFDFKFWVVAWTLDSSNNQLLFMMFLIYILENPKITRRKLTRLNNVTWLMTSRLSIYGCELFKSLRKMETDSQNCLSPIFLSFFENRTQYKVTGKKSDYSKDVYEKTKNWLFWA